MVIGEYTRDSSCGKSGLMETPQAQCGEEAPEPPAESELERKSTGKINRAYNKVLKKYV
jgi:hypothetical protein